MVSDSDSDQEGVFSVGGILIELQQLFCHSWRDVEIPLVYTGETVERSRQGLKNWWFECKGDYQLWFLSSDELRIVLRLLKILHEIGRDVKHRGVKNFFGFSLNMPVFDKQSSMSRGILQGNPLTVRKLHQYSIRRRSD